MSKLIHDRNKDILKSFSYFGIEVLKNDVEDSN